MMAVFVVLGATFVLFMKSWLPPDLVALGAFAVCILCGMLGPKDLAGVFGNAAPLTIGAMFVLSAALARTGVIDAMARLFQKAAQGSELRAMALLGVIVLPLSACINNTPVVVVFLPVVIGFARSASIKASRLLIPLSFLSILGGTMTIFGTSSNILVSDVSAAHGLRPFGVFEITPLGLIYGLVGAAYLFLVGRKLLPERDTVSSLFASADTRDYLTTAEVAAGSPLAGKLLRRTVLWDIRDFRIFYVVRGGQRVSDVPINEFVMSEGDLVVLKANQRGIGQIAESSGLCFVRGEKDVNSGTIKLVEAMVGPRSQFLGKTLAELNLRGQHGIVVAALHRKGANLLGNLSTVPLRLGDTLLIEGPEENLHRFEESQEDIIFLNDEVDRPFRKTRAPLAVAAVLGVVAASALGVPILSAALVGAVVVVLAGCISPGEAYRSIEWPILFIIFGMLGLGQAMENTGAAALLAHSTAGALAPFGPLIVLAAIYLLASTLTEVVTNTAVAILLTPIVITVAADLAVNPRPFVVAVMFGASASFLTPIGYQTNTYIFGAGGYKFSDFPRVGLPLSLLLWVVAVVLIPVFWPL